MLTDWTPVLAKQAFAGGGGGGGGGGLNMHFTYPKEPFVRGLGSDER